MALLFAGGGSRITVLSILLALTFVPVETSGVVEVLTLTTLLTLVCICLGLVVGRLTPPTIGTTLSLRLIVRQAPVRARVLMFREVLIISRVFL